MAGWHQTAVEGNPKEPGRYLYVEMTKIINGHRTGQYLAEYVFRYWDGKHWLHEFYDDGPVSNPYCWMDVHDLPDIPLPKGESNGNP